MIRLIAAIHVAILTFRVAPAFAQEKNWELGLRAASSPSAERLHEFHTMLLYIITGIVLFVFALLLYVIIRFNKRANPTPQQFSHNTLVEVVWTVIPVLILILISLKSFPLLYYVDRNADTEMTLKITGYQWYWGYEYPDNGGVSFLSNMIQTKDIDPSKNQLRLLSTDNPVVLPVDTNIQILVTGADVIHAWAVQPIGVKIDAMPGRTNETWVRITKPGTYYGQCSELCGKDHSFMPIEIKAVPKEEFNAWIAGFQKAPASPT